MKKSQQYQIPLFPEDMFDKIKAAYALIEIEKLREDLKHEKHVRAGYMGAYQKLKNQK